MEYWLSARGYAVVEPCDISIPEFVVTDEMYENNYVATSVDANVPFILQKLFNDTLSVRVICPNPLPKFGLLTSKAKRQKLVEYSLSKQMFLLVRNQSSARFPKNELLYLCNNFLRFANCILIANGILSTSVQILHQESNKHQHVIELLVNDIGFNKLQSRRVPHYNVLSEAEVKELEERLMTQKHQLPRLPISDAIAKYRGLLRPGAVVEITEPTVSYRIVCSSSGFVPIPKKGTDEQKE